MRSVQQIYSECFKSVNHFRLTFFTRDFSLRKKGDNCVSYVTCALNVSIFKLCDLTKKYNYLECMVRYFFILHYGVRGNLYIDQNIQRNILLLGRLDAITYHRDIFCVPFTKIN